MDNDVADFKTLLAAWAAQESAGAGGHPSVEELSDYREGRLAAEDRERVADHVALCRRCFDLLPDVVAFAQAAADRAGAPADFEAAAFWRTLAPRLQELGQTGGAGDRSRHPEPAPRDEARRPAAGPRQRRRSRPWSVPVALAASIVAAFLGWTSWQQHRAIDELRSPRPNVGIYDLFEDTSVRSGAVSASSLSAASGGTLVLTPQEPGSFEDYGIEILDGTGRPAWSGRGLRKTPGDENFSLLLPPGALPPGEYRVVLLGFRNEERHPIEEYAVQLEP